MRGRASGTEPEPVRIPPLHFRRNLVHTADAHRTFFCITEIRLRRGHGQHGGTDACTVHEGDVPLSVPYGQRESFLQLRSVLLQHFHIFWHDNVAVHIHCLLGCGRKCQGYQQRYCNQVLRHSLPLSVHSNESVTFTSPLPNAAFSSACVALSILPSRVKFHELVS